MAKELEITKQIKSAIAAAQITSVHLRHFNDKLKNGRRFKFYGIEPSTSDLNNLNNEFKKMGLNAVASIAKHRNTDYMYWTMSYYTYQKLVVHVTN
jgi:adenylate cyclase class IV